MSTSHFRGHPIIWIEEDQEWVYEDTLKPTATGSHAWVRPCGLCGKKPVPEDGDGDIDPCLGVLPGVANACCGHGTKSDSYIQFTNGVRVSGFGIDTNEQSR